MLRPTLLIEILAGFALLSLAATGGVWAWLRHHQILDEPNHRSSHDQPTPVGGGLAVVPIVALGWGVVALAGMAPLAVIPAAGLGLALAWLGWRDDRSGVRVRYRLLAQVGVVATGLALLPGHGAIFQHLLPVWLDLVLTGLMWLWFLNLYNFMDGIDGLTAVETIGVAGGAALVATVAGEHEAGGLPLGAITAAAALGFLPWNWHRARLFLGDVGSVPLGFLVGWLLLSLAARGLWVPALILPLYYLSDASLTLARRALALKPIWRAHREHFYQRAVQAGRSHARVSLMVAAGNLALVLAALLGLAAPWLALPAAALVVALLLHWLARGPVSAATQP